VQEAGYVVKHKDGSRNRYQVQVHLPLPEADSRERTTGEILEQCVTNLALFRWPTWSHAEKHLLAVSPLMTSRRNR
jgi:hypothetical protein